MSLAGLPTPPQWLTASAGWQNNLQANEFYYCRTLGSAPQRKVLAGGLVDAVVNGSDEWLIQPMLALNFGGAMFVSEQVVYAEGVAGSPVALLRQGELAYASLSHQRTTIAAKSLQESVLVLINGELTPRQAGKPESEDVWQTIVASIAAAMQGANIDGLVEWGWTQDGPVFLDRKLLGETGQLEQYLVSEYWHHSPAPHEALRLDKPALEAARGIDAGRPLRFARGARLSHVVTYRARINDPLSWFDRF